MKIATTLFLLPVLILAGFGLFGYQFKENQVLRGQVDQCVQIQNANNQLKQDNQSITDELNATQEKVASLQLQIDQYIPLLVEKEKGLIQAQNDVQDRDTKLAKALIDLQTVTGQLEQTQAELDQAKSLLAKLNDQISNQPNSYPGPAQAAFTPTDSILGGVLIILVTILGFRKFSLTHQTPRYSQIAKQTRRGQIMMTMSDQTYREFQSYLKIRK